MSSHYPEAIGSLWDEPCPWEECRGRKVLEMRPPAPGLLLGPGIWCCSLEPDRHCGELWPEDLRLLGPLFGQAHQPARRRCVVYLYALHDIIGRSYSFHRARCGRVVPRRGLKRTTGQQNLNPIEGGIS